MMDRERFLWIMDGLDDDQLTLWEADFVDACERGWIKYGKLTEAMEDKLEEIYKRKSK